VLRCCDWKTTTAALEKILNSIEKTGIDTETPKVVIIRGGERREDKDMTWEKIETAPKDKAILLGCQNHPQWVTCGYWENAYWTDGSVASWGYQEVVKLNPTHWMPLPPLPETVK
jgi:hypothetical protein